MNRLMQSTLSVLAVGVVAGVSFWAGERQANAAATAHVYELRTYTATPGNLANLEARFRDHTMALFQKHGMKNVIYMVPVDGPEAENTLVYILEHPSVAAAKESWKAFQTDPDWVAARTASEKNGKLTVKTESHFYQPTDFSPIK